MDEKTKQQIKNQIEEKKYIWGELKSVFTGKFEEMLGVYHEICAGLTSERIGEGKDKRMLIVKESKDLYKTKEKIGTSEKESEKWENTKDKDIVQKWLGGKKYEFKKISTGEKWVKEFID